MSVALFSIPSFSKGKEKLLFETFGRHLVENSTHT